VSINNLDPLVIDYAITSFAVTTKFVCKTSSAAGRTHRHTMNRERTSSWVIIYL